MSKFYDLLQKQVQPVGCEPSPASRQLNKMDWKFLWTYEIECAVDRNFKVLAFKS